MPQRATGNGRGMDTKSTDKIIKKYTCRFSSAHYDFCYSEGSPAQKEIEYIARTQENCYIKITSALNVYPDFRLQYLLADSPEDLGILYGDGEPCNGFARLPDKIYAVYNAQIKCVGMHEDVHIISYSVRKPDLNFISEGLAMYFDGQWQGRSNVERCRELLAGNRMPDIIGLTDNRRFFGLPEAVTYPLAGAFTKFLIDKLTMEGYLREVYYSENPVASLGKLVTDFEDWLLKQ